MIRAHKSKTSERLKRQRQIPRPELCALIRMAQAGDRSARERIVRANIALVRNIAVKFARYTSIHLDDLIQIGLAGNGSGNSGLMRAIDLFDPGVGGAFSTYAGPWITAAISQVVDAGDGAVRIPPRAAALARRLGRALQHTDSLETAAKEAKVSPSRARRLLALPPRGAAEQIAPDGGIVVTGSTCTVQIPDTAPTADVEAERHELKKVIAESLSILTPVERAAVRAHYGIDAREETLERIGRRFRASRERIRRIETEALAKLREHLRVAYGWA